MPDSLYVVKCVFCDIFICPRNSQSSSFDTTPAESLPCYSQLYQTKKLITHKRLRIAFEVDTRKRLPAIRKRILSNRLRVGAFYTRIVNIDLGKAKRCQILQQRSFHTADIFA